MAILFVYGTLLFPEILLKLTGKTFRMQDATLRGYSRYKLIDGTVFRPYPGIIKNSKSSVEGKLVFGVDDESLRRIDFFEDKDYVCEKVQIDSQKALVYVFTNRSKVSDVDWSEDEFCNEHLDEYLNVILDKCMRNYSG